LISAADKNDDAISVEGLLGADGLVAGHFSDFEVRPQQLQMACAVMDAFSANRHLAIEAGTGIGKSFAYLAAAIDRAVHSGTGVFRCSAYIAGLAETGRYCCRTTRNSTGWRGGTSETKSKLGKNRTHNYCCKNKKAVFHS